MRKLIPIFVFSMVMAAISHYASTYYVNEEGEMEYVNKDKMFYLIMAAAMAIFVGLRTAGNDTFAYRHLYEIIPDDISAITDIDWRKITAAPGLQLVCGFLRMIGASTQDYLMLFAIVTVNIYLWFIWKYTDNIWLSVYYFIVMGVYGFTMAAIKQTTAVAFLLIAVDRAIRKKYFSFVLWVLFAELFHPYAFIYSIVPFLFFCPWTMKTWILLAGTIVSAFGLSYLLGDILLMAEALGGSYSVSDFTGEGVNIFRVLVVWVPVLISYMGRKILLEEENRTNNLFINLSMVNAMIMFIGLFGTANYFARLANYFLIFQTLSLPILLNVFDRRSKRLVSFMSVGGYLLYFCYENIFINGSFDNVYRFMTFSDFVKQLF